MTLYALLFYLIAATIVVATGIAVTRRNILHAVVYLVFSFFGSAMLFYLLGAPFLAMLEIIIYAGAIMILFLFIIMMMKVEGLEQAFFPYQQLFPAVGLGLVYILTGILIFFNTPTSPITLQPAVVSPKQFGQFLFQHHWLAIEIISLLLLIALIGALYIGRRRPNRAKVNLIQEKK
jgi:NADH-quinone oxidoreductase subunit J